MSLADPEFDDTGDEVRLLIVRRADAIQMVKVYERAFSRAAHALWNTDESEVTDDLRHEVINTFFDFMDAGREARAQERALDRRLCNLAKVPMPEEVLS
jgi:hypothetical protein